MRILLGLGHAQLRAAGARRDLAENVREGLRQKNRLHQMIELFAVLRHADGGGIADRALARKAAKGRIEHRRQDLADAVGAEIEAQHGVAVLDAAIAADHRRHDELVVDAVGIGIRDGRLYIGKARTLGLDDGVIGLGNAFPALVAVHGIIAADHGHDRHRRRQRGGKIFQIVGRELRRRIAAVGDGMHHRRHAGLGQNARQRDAVILMRMHATLRHQPDQMAGAAALLHLGDQVDHRRLVRDLAGGNRGVDARQVLHGDPAGADVQVTDLGVAHLAGRQADVEAAGREKGAGA